MSKSNIMIIDLSKTNSKFLSGRPNGKQAKELFKLVGPDLSTDIVVKFKDDGKLSVSNSYFLGLIEDLLKIHTDKKTLLEHVDFEDLSSSNQKELVRGINRGFSKIINAVA